MSVITVAFPSTLRFVLSHPLRGAHFASRCSFRVQLQLRSHTSIIAVALVEGNLERGLRDVIVAVAPLAVARYGTSCLLSLSLLFAFVNIICLQLFAASVHSSAKLFCCCCCCCSVNRLSFKTVHNSRLELKLCCVVLMRETFFSSLSLSLSL